MLVFEQELRIPAPEQKEGLLDYLGKTARGLPPGLTPVRFVITSDSDGGYDCELGLLSDCRPDLQPDSIFQLVRHGQKGTGSFNAVLLIPTGIGAEVGGHAGDAGPVAKLMAEVCDRLILHPNVVNASDINEMSPNALYVEGSVLCRFLMGTVGLRPVRSNRVLVVIDAHEDELFINAAVNTVNAARSTYGLDCPRIVVLDPPVRLRARFSSSGRAVGRVEEFDSLLDCLSKYRDEYHAVALSSVIDVPGTYHREYFEGAGKMVNPWGGVEAMLTHAVSSMLNVPSAHAPMFESQEIANMDPGVVDPRMAAEAVSVSFLQCVLKGLQRSPRIVSQPEELASSETLTAGDISVVIIPDGCLGLPTLAALEQGICVVAVGENRNLMRNDLSDLPWRPGQFHRVENYWEAAGVVAALRAGIPPSSLRRPFSSVRVTRSMPTAGMAQSTTGTGRHRSQEAW